MTGRAGARPNAHDRLRALRRIMGPLEAAQVRRFGRSVLSAAFRTPVLLLHTTGRTSGRERTTTLAYRHGEEGSLLVAGGAGGQTRTPDWVANLRSRPVAAVTLRRVRFSVRAEELEGAERERVWAELVAAFPRMATYERRAGRQMPLFRLRPNGGS